MLTNRTHVGAAVLLVVFTAGLLSPSLRAQDLLHDSRVDDAIYLLDHWVDAQQDYQQFPGISMAVVHDQTLLWAKGFGYADVESKTPATPETVYSICSISKLFTSVAAMRLVDQGYLTLDAPVTRALPWFKVAADPAETKLITLRRLLTHTAGLKEDIGTPPDRAPYLYTVTREEFRSRLPKEELRHRPGAHYAYSNLGIALVGEMVSEVSGQSYKEYVTEQILRPLGMTSTSPDIGELWTSGEVAAGYGPLTRGGGRRRVESFRGQGMTPAMGFASTVLDLARFSSWQFRLLNGQDEILSANTLRDMYRVQFADPTADVYRGLGFSIRKQGAEELVGHAGFCAGFRSDLLIDPKRRLATVAMANSMIPAWEFTERAHAILAPAIDAAVSDPTGNRPTPTELLRYVGAYDSFPWSGEWQVIPWNGGLAIIRLPVDDPMKILRPLKRVGAGEFRVLEKDGALGATITFESVASGAVLRLRSDNYPYPRIR